MDTAYCITVSFVTIKIFQFAYVDISNNWPAEIFLFMHEYTNHFKLRKQMLKKMVLYVYFIWYISEFLILNISMEWTGMDYTNVGHISRFSDYMNSDSFSFDASILTIYFIIIKTSAWNTATQFLCLLIITYVI